MGGKQQPARAVIRAGMLGAALAMLGAGCGSTAPAPAGHGHAAAGVLIMARDLPRVGTVLVTGRGYALYMFEPDQRSRVTCTSFCADTWPPVKLRSGAPVAGQGVQQRLLGSDPDPAGGRVVTYNGWPLYTYTADVQPGQTTGQGIDLNGGVWYLIRPSGQPLATAPQS